MATLEVQGPGFFIFFQTEDPGGGGQPGGPVSINRISGIPEDIRNENEEAVILALLLLQCD